MEIVYPRNIPRGLDVSQTKGISPVILSETQDFDDFLTFSSHDGSGVDSSVTVELVNASKRIRRPLQNLTDTTAEGDAAPACGLMEPVHGTPAC